MYWVLVQTACGSLLTTRDGENLTAEHQTTNGRGVPRTGSILPESGQPIAQAILNHTCERFNVIMPENEW